MMVLKLEMWSRGRREHARPLGYATFSLLGQAIRSDAEADVQEGERLYDVKLFKMPQFGGPRTDEDIEKFVAGKAPRSWVWREGRVRGHFPGKRGTWDLIGGAMKHLLGARLSGYKGA